jgi:protein O-GlcNAcase/histone acetyltransferase
VKNIFLRKFAPSCCKTKEEMVIQVEDKFLAGVVEGFYGRPWTCSQRRELFCRMRQSSMNTYIYAPKDDIKHRSLWRQPYTKEEENKLKLLIDASNEEDVTFVYAISPGLDISFSSAGDIAALKRKMKQVSKLGCHAFALLFDDIDPRLKPADAAVFESSAHAQAQVSNELFTYLKEPHFLFCPTDLNSRVATWQQAIHSSTL